jgi:hypothetical protein
LTPPRLVFLNYVTLLQSVRFTILKSQNLRERCSRKDTLHSTYARSHTSPIRNGNPGSVSVRQPGRTPNPYGGLPPRTPPLLLALHRTRQCYRRCNRRNLRTGPRSTRTPAALASAPPLPTHMRAQYPSFYYGWTSNTSPGPPSFLRAHSRCFANRLTDLVHEGRDGHIIPYCMTILYTRFHCILFYVPRIYSRVR